MIEEEEKASVGVKVPIAGASRRSSGAESEVELISIICMLLMRETRESEEKSGAGGFDSDARTTAWSERCGPMFLVTSCVPIPFNAMKRVFWASRLAETVSSSLSHPLVVSNFRESIFGRGPEASKGVDGERNIRCAMPRAKASFASDLTRLCQLRGPVGTSGVSTQTFMSEKMGLQS